MLLKSSRGNFPPETYHLRRGLETMGLCKNQFVTNRFILKLTNSASFPHRMYPLGVSIYTKPEVKASISLET